ncbi:SAM-dependent methyltransferase [Candidatus Uhrbacteria bacterium]|nr:SAM-dependent methyltransferase [Candidatus Uhrbacteria bacterium]
MNIITFLLLLGATLMIAANSLAILWFGPMLLPIFYFGAPYVPTPLPTLEIMLRLADISPADVVVDLGSGDGRAVIAAAKLGVRARGYEIHPGLVKLANSRIKMAKLETIAHVTRQSMWHADVHDATVVFLYQIPYTMNRLGEKLKAELPPGARIVSNAFTIPGWTPEKQEGNVNLYQTKNGN